VRPEIYRHRLYNDAPCSTAAVDMSRPHTPAYTVRRPPIGQGSGSGIARTTTPSRPIITLDEWESKTSLNENQLQSIAFVKEKLGERPFPEKVGRTFKTRSAS